jgi:PAS domain S-box-containing protein
MNTADLSKDDLLKELQELQIKYDSLNQLYQSGISNLRREEIFRLSSDEYMLLHQNAGIGIGYYSPDGTVISYNNIAAKHMNGLPEDFAGKSLYDLFSKEEAEFYHNRIKKAILSDEPTVYEDIVKLPVAEKFFLSTFTKIIDNSNNITGVQIISQDITQLKNIQLALSESERNYRNIFENALSGAAIHKMIFDTEGNPVDYIYLSANSSFEKHTGMRVADIIGKRATEIHPDIRKSNLIQTYGAVASTGVPVIFETFFEPLNRHFSINAYQTAPDHFTTIFQDITESKHAELELREKTEEIEAQSEEYWQINEELNQVNTDLHFSKEKAEESEEKYRALYNNAPLSYQSLDENGCFIDINPMWLKTMGYERSEVLGTWFGNYLHPDFVEHFRINFPAFKQRGYVSDVQFKMKKKDGTFIYVTFEGVIGYTAEGEFKQTYCTFKDITEQKALENHLIKAKEKAEESDRLKTAFLQNMSHEIRTPMNAIMGFSELLVNNYNNKPKLQKFSEIINLRCNDLLDIINDILDIAKIESGQLPVNLETCNLNALFAELTLFFKEHQKRLGKEQIKFNLHSLSNSCDPFIEIDTLKLKQIFINLISNAFKFTDSGVIEGGCMLGKNKNLVFYVSDTGIGIAPDKQQIVFERFAQVEHGSNRLYGGTGLGLSIVNGLVNLLGGEIFLESALGKGSTFSFTIPYKPSQIQQNELQIIYEPDLLVFQNKNILIVEDDLYNAEYLKEILTDKGLNILHTEFGIESVEIATNQPIDLVLMDIRLPDIDGYEATRQIKMLKPQLKIIAQTAFASTDERQKTIDAGCNDYISKPTKQHLLIDLISKHLA